MTKYYAGIGSRDTPESVCDEMRHIASELSIKKGYVLRSGGADGADTAFEEGALKWAEYWLEGNGIEVYLPCKGFNSHPSIDFIRVSQKAKEIASELHPAWDRCSDFAKKLLGRNVYQILGYDFRTPSSFVVCWTKNAKIRGGTAIGIRLAKRHGIPVYNLADVEQQREFYTKILGIKDVSRYLSNLGLENSGVSKQE
jgi:hypothetical protein